MLERPGSQNGTVILKLKRNRNLLKKFTPLWQVRFYFNISFSERCNQPNEYNLIAVRDAKHTNFVEFRNFKIIYRRYAGLYFCICVDVSDNNLFYLEAIHNFVEVCLILLLMSQLKFGINFSISYDFTFRFSTNTSIMSASSIWCSTSTKCIQL